MADNINAQGLIGGALAAALIETLRLKGLLDADEMAALMHQALAELQQVEKAQPGPAVTEALSVVGSPTAMKSPSALGFMPIPANAKPAKPAPSLITVS